MEDYSSAELKAYVEVRGGVVSLDLEGKGLFRVPDAVTELTEVEGLSLYDNNLTELPTSINKLKNLIRLHLSRNNLTKLPSEIGDLKELRRLDVTNNQLVSLPTSIQKLNQLEKLPLNDNKLTELPSEIGDLKELRRLDVSKNQLVSLPTSIQKLNQLEDLNLSDNKLTELPSEIADLKELRALNVSNNQLVGLPSSILKLNQLEKLLLFCIRLTELPSEIGDLKELSMLNVSNNQLVSLPTSIQKLNQLKDLNLSANKLRELPPEIGDLKKLCTLNVSYNQLVSLPTSIQKLNQLEELHLSANKLTELPSEIGDLKELRSLDVSNNQLVSLPTSIRKLKQLEELHLSANKLTELPSEIGDLKELSRLDVSGNPLTSDAKHFLEMKIKGMTEDKTEDEDNTYVSENRIVIKREIVTSEATRWALKLGAVHLIFHPNAVSEPSSIVVYRWKSSVCSPPLQEHEAIVSNVIELSSHDGQRLQFNTMVTLSLSHSAPDLRGYEVVIKRQINKETNEWEDVSGTKNLRCHQDIEDERPSHKDIPDLFFPVAQADINECSTYAVVCRLKSSPPYTITSSGGLFSHPDYPGVTVTVPENALAPESSFTLELKVQEVPNKEFEEEGVFLGPILRIKCLEVVQFFRPVTIQLPVSLRDRQDCNPDPTKCHVRVLFLNCEEEKNEWTELTDLVKPAQFDGSFVRIQVQRFSGYSFLLDWRQENSSVGRIFGYMTRLISKPRRPASFFAYFRPDFPEILRLICCHTHLTHAVIQNLENRDVIYADGSSNQDMIPGEDKAFVFVSGGICPFDDDDVNGVYLRLLEDEFKTELRVRVVKYEDPAKIEFHNTLPTTGRKSLLCKIHLPIQNIPLAARHGSMEHAQQPDIKEGSPTPDELEGLSEKISDKWKKLGRRLQFHDAQIAEHDTNNVALSEKAYNLLMAWKGRDASAATYRVLHKALSDVKRKDLAQEFCCH